MASNFHPLSLSLLHLSALLVCCSQTLTCVSGLPKQTAKYLPSMEKEADHAGEPFSVDGERVASCSRLLAEDDDEEEDVMIY